MTATVKIKAVNSTAMGAALFVAGEILGGHDTFKGSEATGLGTILKVIEVEGFDPQSDVTYRRFGFTGKEHFDQRYTKARHDAVRKELSEISGSYKGKDKDTSVKVEKEMQALGYDTQDNATWKQFGIDGCKGFEVIKAELILYNAARNAYFGNSVSVEDLKSAGEIFDKLAGQPCRDTVAYHMKRNSDHIGGAFAENAVDKNAIDISSEERTTFEKNSGKVKELVAWMEVISDLRNDHRLYSIDRESYEQQQALTGTMLKKIYKQISNMIGEKHFRNFEKITQISTPLEEMAREI